MSGRTVDEGTGRALDNVVAERTVKGRMVDNSVPRRTVENVVSGCAIVNAVLEGATEGDLLEHTAVYAHARLVL